MLCSEYVQESVRLAVRLTVRLAVRSSILSLPDHLVPNHLGTGLLSVPFRL